MSKQKIIVILIIGGFSFCQAAPDPDLMSYEGFLWPNQTPGECPFEQSEEITGIYFTGRNSDYYCGDTFYPTWADDDNLYSPFTDGSVDGVGSGSGYPTQTTGNAVMIGDDPQYLTITNTASPQFGATYPYGGRYPCGSLMHNGVWYYGTYCLGVTKTTYEDGYAYAWPILGPIPGFRISIDYGQTWTPSPLTPENPLFPEPSELFGPVKIGAPHFVDFGKNMEHSPDGKAYLVCMGAEENDPMPRYCNLSWCSSDQVYLVRVTPSIATINDINAYEFFAGHDVQDNPIWSNNFEDIKPLLDWNNHMGCVTVTYNAPLQKYFMCVTDGWRSRSNMDSYIMEADDITGPWKMVTYMAEFGTQGYFLNFPSKFTSADGKTMWLCYSGNYGGNTYNNPPHGRYGLCLYEVQLLDKEKNQFMATKAHGDSLNITSKATITVSSTLAGTSAANLVNGKVCTHAQCTDDHWTAANNTEDAWVQLTFDEPQILRSIKLFDCPGRDDRTKYGKILFSNGDVIHIRVPQPNSVFDGLDISWNDKKVVTWLKVIFEEVEPASANVSLSEIMVFEAEWTQATSFNWVNMNGDGIINLDDFAKFSPYWQQLTDGDADFDGNETVDITDLSYIAQLWLETPGKLVVIFDDFGGNGTGFSDGWSGSTFGPYNNVVPGLFISYQAVGNGTTQSDTTRSFTEIDLSGDATYYLSCLYYATGEDQSSALKLQYDDIQGPQILWRDTGWADAYIGEGTPTDEIDFLAEKVYLAVLKIDCNPMGTDDAIYLNLYNLTDGQMVPLSEPTVWQTVKTTPDFVISKTNNIQLVGRGSIDSTFDNILLTRDWIDVLMSAQYDERTILAFEDFDGGMIGFNGTGWSGRTVQTSDEMAPGFGNYALTTSISADSHRQMTRAIDLTGNGVYYMSMLFRTAGVNYQGMKLLETDGSIFETSILFTNTVYSGPEGDGELEIFYQGSHQYPRTPYKIDKTYLTVMKFVCSTVADDSMYMAVYNLTDGDIVPTTEPTTWTLEELGLSFSRSNCDDISLLGQTGQDTKFDNILVTTDWADVVASVGDGYSGDLISVFEDFDGGDTGFSGGSSWSGTQFGPVTGIAPGLGNSYQALGSSTSEYTTSRDIPVLDMSGDATYYLSCLYYATGEDQYSVLKFRNGTLPAGIPSILFRNSGWADAYTGSGSTANEIDFLVNKLYLAVLKIDCNPTGTNDAIYLNLYNLTDGDVVPLEEPTVWQTDGKVGNTTANFIEPSVNNIQLVGRGSIDSTFDNILITTKWSDVAATVP